jgi:cholesterol transport system auxiliary component
MRDRNATDNARPSRAIAASDRNATDNARPSRAIAESDRNVSSDARPSRAINARSFFRALVAGALLIALTGCLGLGGDKTTAIYSPQVKIETKADWPTVTWPLMVNKPLASEALDSSGIAVRPTPGELQVYAGAQWADAAPDMLQTALVQGFEDSGKIASVGRQGTGLRGDFVLMLDLRHFESVYADSSRPPSAVIEVQAKLLVNPSSQVMATRTFRVSVPARDKDVPQVVDAFQGAMTDLVGQVVGWTLTTGQTVKAQAAAR